MGRKIKGRIVVVDDKTIEMVKDEGVWGAMLPKSIRENDGKKINEGTIINIMNDMLNIAIGDYIILWKNATKKNGGEFYGIYRAISKAYIDCNKFKFENNEKTEYPFRVKLGEAYKFSNPIEVYKFINEPEIKNSIWTIIGKKISGKSRASIPITKEIIEIFIKEFISLNDKWEFIKMKDENTSKKGEIKFQLEEKEIGNFMDDYNIRCIEFLNSNKRKVSLELVLYGIFNQYIDAELNGSNDTKILEALEIKGKTIEWYANYLPYGIERTEIDFMISISEDGESTTEIKVIEFARDNIDMDHLERVCKYTDWVNKNLCKRQRIATAVLIGYDNKKMGINKEQVNIMKEKYKIKNIRILTYYVEDKKLKIKNQYDEELSVNVNK